MWHVVFVSVKWLISVQIARASGSFFWIQFYFHRALFHTFFGFFFHWFCTCCRFSKCSVGRVWRFCFCFWWVLQHRTGFARLVWGRLRVHRAFIYSNRFVYSLCSKCSVGRVWRLFVSFDACIGCHKKREISLDVICTCCRLATCYGEALVGRIDIIIGLFERGSKKLHVSFEKEPY